MGQHFVSILYIYIIYKQKDPKLISGSLYVSAEAVRSVAKHTSGTQWSGETSFHRYITHVWVLVI